MTTHRRDASNADEGDLWTATTMARPTMPDWSHGNGINGRPMQATASPKNEVNYPIFTDQTGSPEEAIHIGARRRFTNLHGHGDAGNRAAISALPLRHRLVRPP